jgi:uncharacterized cupin superfamily protein
MIEIEHEADRAGLEGRGVFDWPIWEKEVSRFDWTYESAESCYILAGEVTVTPAECEPVRIVAGDFVTFPAGMRCVWDITLPIRKHYRFG